MMDRPLEIIPGILEDDWAGVRKKLATLSETVHWIHLDVSDGKFTPRQTWRNPSELVEWTRRPHEYEEDRLPVLFEIHLMVVRPWEHIERWLYSGAQRFIIHWEACINVPENLGKTEEMISKVQHLGKEMIFGLKLETKLPNLSHYSSLGGVLLMAHEVGYSGRALDPTVFNKVAALRRTYPDVTIELDGGVNDTNIDDIVRAGCRRIVATSYVWSASSPQEALATLLKKGHRALRPRWNIFTRRS